MTKPLRMPLVSSINGSAASRKTVLHTSFDLRGREAGDSVLAATGQCSVFFRVVLSMWLPINCLLLVCLLDDEAFALRILKKVELLEHQLSFAPKDRLVTRGHNTFD